MNRNNNREITYLVLSIILLSLQCFLYIKSVAKNCTFTFAFIIFLVTAHICGLYVLAPKMAIDSRNFFLDGNINRLLLAVITHKDEWHLNYALTLFIRYGVAFERRLPGWDLIVHLFFVVIFSSVISLFISEFACTLFANQFFQTYELLGFAEAASTLGVIYCLNGHGTFKQFNLPFGFHVRISRSLQRWVAFFCSDVRRAFNFPFAFIGPIISGILCFHLFNKLQWNRSRQSVSN